MIKAYYTLTHIPTRQEYKRFAIFTCEAMAYSYLSRWCDSYWFTKLDRFEKVPYSDKYELNTAYDVV